MSFSVTLNLLLLFIAANNIFYTFAIVFCCSYCNNVCALSSTVYTIALLINELEHYLKSKMAYYFAFAGQARLESESLLWGNCFGHRFMALNSGPRACGRTTLLYDIQQAVCVVPIC